MQTLFYVKNDKKIAYFPALVAQSRLGCSKCSSVIIAGD